MKLRTARRELQTLREELSLNEAEAKALERRHQNELDVMKLKLNKKDEQIEVRELERELR